MAPTPPLNSHQRYCTPQAEMPTPTLPGHPLTQYATPEGEEPTPPGFNRLPAAAARPRRTHEDNVSPLTGLPPNISVELGAQMFSGEGCGDSSDVSGLPAADSLPTAVLEGACSMSRLPKAPHRAMVTPPRTFCQF